MRRIGLYVFVCSYFGAVLAYVLIESGSLQKYTYAGILVASAILARILNSSIRSACIFSVAAICIAVLRTASFDRTLPDAFTPLIDQKVTLQGIAVSLPDERESSTRILLEIKSGIETTKVIAAVPLYPPIYVGDILRVQGTVKLPEPFETDGGRTFEYADFLSKDGVFALMQPAFPEIIGRSDSYWLMFLRALQLIKSKMMKLIGETLPEPQSSLAAGLLVGGKQGLGAELIEAFTEAGMLQIIVLSGYNVMIVANTLMRALGFLPKRISFGVGSFSIACFVLIAGAGSSALRAGLMAFLAIGARTFEKKYDVLKAVIASIGILGFWNPLMLVYDPGFQFSFIATLGLIIGVPVVAPRLQFLKYPLLIELVSTTLAAEFALLPFLLWQTGHLSLVSVFANIIAMPAVPFAMASSVAAAALTFPLGYIASVLPVIVGMPAYIPLAYIINVATLSASLPFANNILPAFPFWVVILSYAALGLLVHRETKRLRRESDAQPHPS